MKRPSLNYLLTLSILTIGSFCFLSPAAAQKIDTINFDTHKLNTAALKPGLRQYLVYFQMSKQPKNLMLFLWSREIKKEMRNGQEVFAISQQWYGNDTAMYRKVYSINSVKDFAPIYHAEQLGNKPIAFNWSKNQIKGADTVPQNVKKDFKLDFAIPCFNWNLDIETFEMLPLAEGKTFAINFYDAGSQAPKYVLYKVEGSEVLTTTDLQKVDCWILLNESENNGNKFAQRFWVSKKNKELLKEEDTFKNGYRYKIKLNGAAPSLLPRFAK